MDEMKKPRFYWLTQWFQWPGPVYWLRRWLFIKLMPKNLTVYCFDGMKDAPGTGIFEPKREIGWGKVDIYWAEVVVIDQKDEPHSH